MKKEKTITRRMLSPEEWIRLMESKSKSGLSIKAFCLDQGISKASYFHWRKRLAGRQERRDELFSPIVIESKPAGSEAVELPGGVVIRLSELPLGGGTCAV